MWHAGVCSPESARERSGLGWDLCPYVEMLVLFAVSINLLVSHELLVINLFVAVCLCRQDLPHWGHSFAWASGRTSAFGEAEMNLPLSTSVS